MRVTSPTPSESKAVSRTKIEVCSVHTERQEVANISSISVVLKGKGNHVSIVHHLGKRKHPNNKNTIPEIWLDTLTANLKCAEKV